MKNFLKDKRILQKKDGISVIEQEKLPFYEWLEYKQSLHDELKDKNKQVKEENKKQNDMKSNAQNKFKMPKMKMPKIG